MSGQAGELTHAQKISALRWWLDSGVDTPVQDEPRQWLQPGAEQAEAAPQPGSAPAARAPAPQAPAAPAPAAPDMPESLDLFRDWLAASDALPAPSKGARRVLPLGAGEAPVMLLADAPGNEEAMAGQPIAGEAWTLTQRMLAAIGIAFDQAYCANISCFHAPGSRLDSRALEACAIVARKHVALARPKRLLLLGDGPSQALLGKPAIEARGHVHLVEGIRTVATFHPRFLLKHPSSKALAWKDLLLLNEDRP